MEEKDILQQEKELQFHKFKNDLALKFGLKVVSYVSSHQLKSVGIRITYKGLLVFQYIMDGKKEDSWLKRKEKTVLSSQHSGYYTFFNQEKYSEWLDDEQYVLCGGGFPIIEDGEVVGAICVSGLKHDDDHLLIINTLKELLEEEEQ